MKKTFKYEQVSELEDDQVQSIWLKGGYNRSKEIFFGHFYREHLSRLSRSEQQSYLDKLLCQWESAANYGGSVGANETHVCGDMNIDLYQEKWLQSDYPLISLSKLLKNFCHSNNFHQLVKGITRVQHNSVNNSMEVSCIDHVYTNAKFRCSDPEIIGFGDSDHDLVKYLRFAKVPAAPTRIIKKRSYKKFDRDAFLQDVASVDWFDVFSCSDVDIAAEVFTNKFKYILNMHAPWVQFQQRRHFQPWITDVTKSLMKTRDDWKNIAKNLTAGSLAQIHAWQQFKKFRNKVNNRKKFEESNFVAQKMTEVADSPDLMWKGAKSFMGWKSPGTPQQIQTDNGLLTSSKKIAQCMNKHFIEKVNTIRASMIRTAFLDTNLKDFMRQKNCQLQLQHININKISKILKSLSNSRSTGIDELDNFSLKIAADFVKYPIHHIVCLSIIQNKFPENWKCSKVIPLYKKGDQLDKKNYRPVAILSPLSKVLEKVVYEQIYSYFTRNSLFHPNLHGYRNNRSTQTALLQVYDRWIRAAHEGKTSGVVLLDLSAAFDLVDKELLLKKLQIYGFAKDILTWIESYLTDRCQSVWIDYVFSDFLYCEAGVPQGSNLGPLLFLIFFNDLPLSVGCPVDTYADDSTLTVSGNSVEEIGTSLTECCQSVSQWMLSNKLKLNVDKTHLLTVGTRARLRIQESSVKVFMGGQELSESENGHEMLLGCFIEQDLKWHKQIDYVMRKLQSRLNALRKLGNKIPKNMRCRLAEGLFLSVLTYCLPVYGGCDTGELNALQIMQNSAARYVTQAGKMTSRLELFRQVGWLSVRQLVIYHSALCTFRIRQSQEPEYLGALMKRDNRTNKIIIPNTNLTLAKRSFCFRGAEDWNRLPGDIRSCGKMKQFKIKLRKWIIQNVPPFDAT